MNSKNVKTTLLVSLITTIVTSLSLGNFVQADSYTTVNNKGMYDYLVEILDRKDFEKTSTINGVDYNQNISVLEYDNGVFNVTNNYAITYNNNTKVIVMNYQLKSTPTGIEVIIQDQPKLKVVVTNQQTLNTAYNGESLITHLGYVSGAFPATIVTQAGGTIHNGFLSGSDSYTQTCWGDSTTWSMSFPADTSWQETHSNDWRNVNWVISDDESYLEWCIFPFYTHATKVTVSGTDYSNSNTYYGLQAIGPAGWSGSDIENPWDAINFKVEFKQKQLP